jgi:flagellar hook-associated protein 1 FlgK
VSTFGGLNTAYTGLVAARQGLDVVGQNIANVNTEGYTRQRVSASAIDPLAQAGMSGARAQAGQGVSVDGIARLGSAQLDAQVRSQAAAAGYSSVRANALSAVENSMQEPGANGLSAQLQDFWAGWQDVANAPGEAAPAAVLLGQAGALTARISQGYEAVSAEWSTVRSDVGGMVTEVNTAAAQVAQLNVSIRSTLATGGSANEMLDRRSTLTTTIAALTGGTVTARSDGTVDITVGGNALVSGDTSQLLQVAGASSLDGTGGPVRVEWARRPGTPVAVDGGELAGALSLLAPADATATGGVLAEAAASYNMFAAGLADSVNAVHQAGATTTGTTGLSFFSYDPAHAARSLAVVPTDATQIATGTPGAGALDATVADAVAQLGVGPASPSAAWSTFVTSLGATTRSALQHASLADQASTSAVKRQLSNSSVDLDEENVNLLMFQHAYQGAARVMTAVDEMLDTLINHTGLVGR